MVIKYSLSNAYEEGIGEWDKVSVAYSYSDFPESVNEQDALNKIIEKSSIDGHRFITDKDARPIGGAHPIAHLWDNGKIATDELERLMKIREIALNNFINRTIYVREKTYSTLEDRLVPIYLLHRYQIEAVVKLIGGIDLRLCCKREYRLSS